MRGLLTSRRCDEIKKEILFMYEEAEVHSYPIDCFAIAKKLHYVLKPYSSLQWEDWCEARSFSLDGFSVVEVDPFTGMNEYVIYYNDETRIIGRVRWTVFHEIGHIYLGHHDHTDSTKETIEEAEADFFAKYAIAPPPLICALKCENMWDVKNTFNTSDEASYNIFDYYKKWLKFGPTGFQDFERKIIDLFNVA